jgi:hypothetical protein
MLHRRLDDHLDDQDLPEVPPAAPRPRLAVAGDVGVESAARRLQQDLAVALEPPIAWSVRRTVLFGVVFHVAVLGALALAAGGALSHLPR